jgi:Ca-activated chloride channel family protein
VSDGTYKLDELARAAGTSARTVRYYVQRGLLPAPAFRGKDTAYNQEHLVRLRAIRRLQEVFFPLDAIAIELQRRTLAEIEHLADGGEMPVAAQLEEVSSLTSSSERPALAAKPSTSRVRARVFHRFELAPGVELSIAEDAPSESRETAEKILAGLQREEGA